MKTMTCAEARQTDLVDYLSGLGHLPMKIRNQDYWYLSPLRKEKTASFKVNRIKNLWFDFGTGLGGDILDFGVLFHKCSVNELLKSLNQSNPAQLSYFHPQTLNPKRTMSTSGEKEKDTRGKIVVTDIRPLTGSSLLEYLESRGIPFEIANRYCQKVEFILYDKIQTAIGFQNNLGGYELRNKDFKGSSSPKTIKFIENTQNVLSVFEGFFNFLSFLTINENIKAPITNYLVLNSLSFFEKSTELMEKHKTVHLFLDRDNAGTTQTIKALERNKFIYMDKSDFYKDHKDFNDWLIENHQKFNLAKRIIQKTITNK
jgi:DNA primase